LRTSASGRTLIYAETLVALERLHPIVRSGLLSISEPIGRLLIAARLETFRDILTAGTERAGGVGAHFGINRDDERLRTHLPDRQRRGPGDAHHREVPDDLVSVVEAVYAAVV
jgi:chorismate-pyruvate lyase